MFSGPFDRSPFGRPYAVDTFLTALFDSTTSASAHLSVEFPVVVVFDSASAVGVDITREITFAADVQSATDLAAQMLRERLIAAGFASSTQVVASPTYAHVDMMSFTGDIAPGDRLVIDTRTQTITLNGVNVMHLLDGDFFELDRGVNVIKYGDDEVLRQILARFTHRDRYLS